jgi:hypothetical protein
MLVAHNWDAVQGNRKWAGLGAATYWLLTEQFRNALCTTVGSVARQHIQRGHCVQVDR